MTRRFIIFVILLVREEFLVESTERYQEDPFLALSVRIVREKPCCRVSPRTMSPFVLDRRTPRRFQGTRTDYQS